MLPRNQSDDMPPPPPPVFSKFINWVYIYCISHSVAYESKYNTDLSWWTLHLIQLIICMWYLLLLLPFNRCFDKTEAKMFCRQRSRFNCKTTCSIFFIFSFNVVSVLQATQVRGQRWDILSILYLLTDVDLNKIK